MKKLLIALLCAGICLGLVGCSGVQKEEHWKELLESRLSKLGVDDVIKITADSYESGDEIVYPKIETKITTLEAEIFLRNGKNWEIIEIRSDNEDKTYYLSENVDEIDSYDIYDYKTDKIKKAKKEEISTNQSTNENNENDLALLFSSKGYKNFNGNWRKDTKASDGSTIYSLFNLTDKYFDVSDDTGISMSYFWNDNYAGHSYCKYDFNSSAPIAGSECDEQGISNLTSLKNIFDKELISLGLTIEDLNK